MWRHMINLIFFSYSFISSSLSGFLSFDINLTSKDLNQCDDLSTKLDFKKDQIEAFLGSHKCHKTSSDVSILKLGINLGYK